MSRLSGTTIRAATPGDLGNVRALLAESALPIDGLDEQFGDGYAVALHGDAVVGVVGIECYGPDGLLRSAAIAPSHRGLGVGRDLVRDRIEWARRRGLRAVYLLTTTADNYFPRFGFTTLDRSQAPAGIRTSREFADACPASATFMRMPLGLPENL
jgi:amino-acid N-acetyltransferase